MAGDRAERDKDTKAEAGYEPKATGPDECRRCEHFIFGKPPACEVVKGPVSWHAWCRKFMKRGVS